MTLGCFKLMVARIAPIMDRALFEVPHINQFKLMPDPITASIFFVSKSKASCVFN